MATTPSSRKVPVKTHLVQVWTAHHPMDGRLSPDKARVCPTFCSLSNVNTQPGSNPTGGNSALLRDDSGGLLLRCENFGWGACWVAAAEGRLGRVLNVQLDLFRYRFTTQQGSQSQCTVDAC